MPDVLGVLGYPLAQSLSPYLHSRAFGKVGIEAAYTAWEVAPENLASFMRQFREEPFVGASVTIPHKVAVIPFLDAATEEAKIIGAVNTLYWSHGKVIGHNTDMEGFIAPLRTRLPLPHAVVFGAGGATRAVLAGLSRVGVDTVTLMARKIEKAERLASEFAPGFASLTVADWEGRDTIIARTKEPLLVVNTTPLGMRGKAEGESPLTGTAFTAASRPGECIAYDIVYNPLKTAFLADAEAAGWRTVDGLAMFVRQAAAQFGLWTGKEMEIAWAHELLAAKFTADSGEA